MTLNTINNVVHFGLVTHLLFDTNDGALGFHDVGGELHNCEISKTIVCDVMKYYNLCCGYAFCH